MSGSRIELRTPQGELSLRLPAPGPLQRLQRGGRRGHRARARGAARHRGRGARVLRRAPSGAWRRSPCGGRELSILLIKNPAGANEVLRTLTLEDGSLDLWLALNDRIADGRDVSWIWDADFELLRGRVRRVTCSGTRAEEMARAPEVRGAGRRDRGGARPGPTRSTRRSSRRGGLAAVRPAHLHGAARAARPAVAARPGRPGGRREVHAPWPGTTWSAPPTRPTSSSGASWPARAAGRCSTSGCGTGRVALDLAERGHAVTAVDADAELVAELGAPRAGARPAGGQPGRRRAHARARPPLRPRARRRCRWCSCSAAGRDGWP